MPIIPGNQLRTTATFKDEDSVNTNPTAVTLSVKNPSDVVTVYTYGVGTVIVRDATGIYHADIDVNDDGLWFFEWRGTGAVVAANGASYTVARSHIS